ncbi:MAG: sulfurtransferase-like selenium metabolism protein YedF [Synergistaceae bacterium]|nr:sulfurtransferase-like selenium metabolism protein YedF [Synergistaceae bacterium]
MEIIDVLGKPCPIPVIESKKALAKKDTSGVLVKVDNIVAVQNLEKMANGYGYGFSYVENSKDSYDVTISKDEKSPPTPNAAYNGLPVARRDAAHRGLIVVISRNTMGEGAEELGKILIKGFIYSLTELPVLPECLIFFNSGAYLTSDGSNTIDDLRKMEERGVEIFTCGTCVNYYGLQDKLAVGAITDMYGITEKMASASNIINI